MSLPALGTGWLTGLAVAAVVVVNLAGLGGIALARRGAIQDARRASQAQAAARALAVADLLAAVVADLKFVGASVPLSPSPPARGHPGAADWPRPGAEGALLLFLRGHAAVVRVVVRSGAGRPLLQAGRRGGVPILWLSADPTGDEGAALAPGRTRLVARVALEPAPGRDGSLQLEAEVESPALLAGPDDHGGRTCALHDARGALIVRHPAGAGEAAPAPDASTVLVEAPVAAPGWSAPAPWSLRCAQPQELALGLVGPVVARYRTTLALNLVAMVLALFLGGFAVQQARRRGILEAAAREGARVRELERRLLHAERLTTVGRLAAGIAHEINNPLEGMANYLALARDDLARGDAAAARRRLDGVKEGLERAAATVRQVLAHADPARAPLRPLDLNEVLRENGRFMASRAEFAGVAFRFELDGSRLMVNGDNVRLGQVAVNLMLNACEAQPGGGEVVLRSRRDGAQALAEFGDRGPGVAEADRQRIFEPFFSTKDSTGLGLSVCHAIVRQHGGELSVGPREGGGALFCVRLPALAEERRR